MENDEKEGGRRKCRRARKNERGRVKPKTEDYRKKRNQEGTEGVDEVEERRKR